MSPEQRDEYLKTIAQDDPKIAEAIADDIQENNQGVTRDVEHIDRPTNDVEVEQSTALTASIDI